MGLFIVRVVILDVMTFLRTWRNVVTQHARIVYDPFEYYFIDFALINIGTT